MLLTALPFFFLFGRYGRSVPQAVLDALRAPGDIVRPKSNWREAVSTMPLVHPQDFLGGTMPTLCSPTPSFRNFCPQSSPSQKCEGWPEQRRS